MTGKESRMILTSAQRQEDRSMKNSPTIRMMVLGISIGAFTASVAYPSLAQNALGGPAKTKQNAIGGASKPAPVIGGATPSTAAPTKPATVGSMNRRNATAGTATPIGNATAPGPTGATSKQTAPVTPPNKGSTVVTTSSNLKCAAGACVAKKP
jgi:hypothetical protein